MEAERILADSMPCALRIAMPHDYAATLEVERFDVILIDAAVVESSGSGAIMMRQHQRGSVIIFTTLTNDAMEGLIEFQGFASVAKPFVDDELISVVTMALRLPELDI